MKNEDMPVAMGLHIAILKGVKALAEMSPALAYGSVRQGETMVNMMSSQSLKEYLQHDVEKRKN